VEAQRATLTSAEAQSAASEAGVKAADENIRTMQAALEHDQADLDRMKADYQRAEQLFNEKLGAKQDFEMKKYVYDAQVAALDSNQKRSWRGAHGVFGFIEPGAATGDGCRAYSQTIYVAGRPNRGHGSGCKQPDGSWKMTS